MTDVPDHYWLGRWVDEYEVTTAEQLPRLLSLPGPMARLAELASSSPNWTTPNPLLPELSVAAGQGIDLSGSMSCGAFECMRKAVDAAYPRIFHYFDYIVAEGSSPREFIRQLKSLPKSRHTELHREIV